MTETQESKFIVRFRDANGMWFNITEESVSKEKAEEIYNNQTYHGQLWSEPHEQLFFQIKEVG